MARRSIVLIKPPHVPDAMVLHYIGVPIEKVLRLEPTTTAWTWDRLLDKLRESGQLDFSYAAVIPRLGKPLGRAKPGQTPPIAHDQAPSTASS